MLPHTEAVPTFSGPITLFIKTDWSILLVVGHFVSAHSPLRPLTEEFASLGADFVAVVGGVVGCDVVGGVVGGVVVGGVVGGVVVGGVVGCCVVD